jgi:hypothetical protein
MLASAGVAMAAWILCLAVSPLFAAEPMTSGVMGSVVDSQTGKPLPFATVLLTPATPYPDMPEGGVGANSKGDGSYKVNARPGTYTLSVSYLGYQK